MLKPKFKAQASGLSPVGRCLIEHTPNVLLYGRRASNPVTSSNTTSSITYQLAHKRNSYTYVCSSTIFHSSFLSPVLVFYLNLRNGSRISRFATTRSRGEETFLRRVKLLELEFYRSLERDKTQRFLVALCSPLLAKCKTMPRF